ncbi:UNVERIFIED_CONTAM: zinc ribbon domain-containing protein, partial [Aerococcus urinaeequi]
DARYEHHSWRFFDFEEKLMYKALESGSQVLKVSAQFTSQRCPKCESIDKANRQQDLELRKQRYHCRECNSYFTAKSEIVGDNCFISKRVKRMVLDFATNALTLKHIAETC